MSRRPKPIPILVYHQIDAAPPKGAAFRSLYVSPGAFARQMALLSWMGYQGLSMDKLLPYLQGERSGKVVAELKGVMDSEDLESLKAKTDALAQVSMKLGEAMYKAGQADGAGEAAGAAQQPKESGVVDADFEEVHDDKKKSA